MEVPVKIAACRAALFAPLGALLLLLSACSPPNVGPRPGPTHPNQPASVTTQTTHFGDVSRVITVTGSLQAQQEVALSAKQPGRLVAVMVREGDAVTAGQALARVDDSDLQRQVRTGEAAVASSVARLQQAEASYAQQTTTTGAGISAARAAYEQQVTTSAAAVQSAESAVKAAQANLSALQEGARSEEREQTQAALKVAQANFRNAEADMKRYKALHAVGYVSDAEFDQHSTAHDVAEANLQAAQAAAKMQQNGTRRQDLEQAQERVRQADDALRQARAGQAQDAVRKADLQTAIANRAQDRVRLADVQAAQAALEQSQDSLAIARQAVSDAVVRAPFSGRISARSAEPGQVVSSATVVLKLVTADCVYFEPSVPEDQIGLVHVGQRVAVSVDSIADRVFGGLVSKVYPTSSSANRSVPIRVNIGGSGGMLRPQAFATGRIETEAHPHVVLAPKASILADTGEGSGSGRVFTVEGGVARVRKVKAGLASSDGAWIEVAGIGADTPVIVQGLDGLADGAQVAVNNWTTRQ